MNFLTRLMPYVGSSFGVTFIRASKKGDVGSFPEQVRKEEERQQNAWPLLVSCLWMTSRDSRRFRLSKP